MFETVSEVKVEAELEGWSGSRRGRGLTPFKRIEVEGSRGILVEEEEASDEDDEEEDDEGESSCLTELVCGGAAVP